MKVEGNIEKVVTTYEKVDTKQIKNNNREVALKDVVREESNNSIKEKTDLKQAVEKINKHLEASGTKLKFKIHDSSSGGMNRVSIKVVEQDEEKVIAEIPSEDAIEFAERMDKIIGVLFDQSK